MRDIMMNKRNPEMQDGEMDVLEQYAEMCRYQNKQRGKSEEDSLVNEEENENGENKSKTENAEKEKNLEKEDTQNEQIKEMGQVVLANFTNPNGLTSLGGNQWAETTSSGQALVGAPGTGTLGVLQSAAVEESNTDLTAELVNMITQQRNYQANAQSIKTQDQVMQTLVNLR